MDWAWREYAKEKFFPYYRLPLTYHDAIEAWRSRDDERAGSPPVTDEQRSTLCNPLFRDRG